MPVLSPPVSVTVGRDFPTTLASSSMSLHHARKSFSLIHGAQVFALDVFK
jgi:hypothetical protein